MPSGGRTARPSEAGCGAGAQNDPYIGSAGEGRREARRAADQVRADEQPDAQRLSPAVADGYAILGTIVINEERLWDAGTLHGDGP